MIATRLRFLIPAVVILMFWINGQSQVKFTGYFEPAIALSYQVNPKYRFSFGFEIGM